MEEKNINVQELIKVEALPKIFYQLELIGKEVEIALEGIEDMECNEANKKEVKKRKQEITKFKNMMEDRRKEIKNQVMAKYNEFNEKYELEVKNKLVNAENILNEKVNTIEVQQKLDKENELREFAKSHFEYNNIEDIVTFEDIKLNITLSASLKSLKEQIYDFCKKVVADLKLIELEEYKDEILMEYKESLDFSISKLNVVTRHKKIEELKQKQEEKALEIAQNQQIEEEITNVLEDEEVTAPIELEEELITVAFEITATKEQILELKQFLKERGINYG